MTSAENGEDDEDRDEQPLPMAERSRSMRRARTHFAIAVTGALVATALLIAMGAPNAIVETLENLNDGEAVPVPVWVAFFLVAVLGALTKRAHAIAYYGFKLQEYEPVTWRYHLAVGWRATLVALAFVGLGNVITVGELANRPAFALAFTFAAGYFGESTFQVFEQRYRQLIGNEQSPRRSVRKPVDGIDVPIDELLAADEGKLCELLGKPEDAGLQEIVDDLEDAGFISTREVLGAWLTSGGQDELEQAVGTREGVQTLVRLADLQRVGVPAPLAVELMAEGVTRVEDLEDPSLLAGRMATVNGDQEPEDGSGDDGENDGGTEIDPFADLVARRARRLTSQERF